MPDFHYLALQYSAIQKTVLRHDRLWSIAGISLILSFLNEIELTDLACRYNGTVLVAGGGKFTVRFKNQENAQAFRGAAVKLVATALPMLEFQMSRESIADATLIDVKKRLIDEDLAVQKRSLRGYGITFNPHLACCEECGEYPAEEKIYRDKQPIRVCRFCAAARRSSKIKLAGLLTEHPQRMTTIENVYSKYSRAVNINQEVEAPLNFEDMFPYSEKDCYGPESGGHRRMAVWFSDINNMNTKVPVWLEQPEDQIKNTFDQVKNIFIDALVDALAKTDFIPNQRPDGRFLPFRLIVAGGDDLCLVMDEQYVMTFAEELSSAVNQHINNLNPDHPLHPEWLNARSNGRTIEPYGFGAAFIITPIHTPFSRIYAVGEELMKDAKEVTGRKANSINWRIMSESNSLTEQVLKFERPVFIDNTNAGGPKWPWLTFIDYLSLTGQYDHISTSHIQQLISWMIETGNDANRLETKMMMGASSELEKSYSSLLEEKELRNSNGELMPSRLATLLELLSISGQNNK
jgi:hypothetical protein